MESNRPSAFSLMTKPRGAICNLDCKYCYFLSKERLYPGSDFRMSETLLEEYTRQYIEAQQVSEVTFAWQGGEPTLMGLNFYRQAVGYQQKCRKPGMRIVNAFQTNAVTLDDAWCEFFAENKVRQTGTVDDSIDAFASSDMPKTSPAFAITIPWGGKESIAHQHSAAGRGAFWVPLNVK